MEEQANNNAVYDMLSKETRTLMDEIATIGFFQVHYQFPHHFPVLCDLYFLKHLAVHNINPRDALTAILKGKLKLFTTECIMQELKKESKYNLDESVFTLLVCKSKVHDHDICVENVIGNRNENKFYFATVIDHDLHLKMQKKPAVPVIVGVGDRLVLKRYSDRQEQLAAAFKDQIPVEKGSPLEEINEVILFYKRYYGIKFPPQVLIDGPSFRYLASNAISLADVAKAVGTTLRSLHTTCCIFGEIKRAGEDMNGALCLASSLMFASCGHNKNEAGDVCYRSLLLRGRHIGTSFESSNSGSLENLPMMERVPFIIAEGKELIVKPPSETLIRSKEMPQSVMTLLLDLAKSHYGKDQKAENKRIDKKERVEKRNALKDDQVSSKKMKYEKK